MVDDGVRILHLTSEKEALEALRIAEVEPRRIQEMVPKILHQNVIIGHLGCKPANIIEQAMIATGGYAVVVGGEAQCDENCRDIILTGTERQLRQLIEKIELMPFGLRNVSERLCEMLRNSAANSFELRTSRRRILLGERTLIMGIINVTPDSFSDGGRFQSPGQAVEAGIRMSEEGADIIDIGGESTRPGSDPVSEEEEKNRIIPVIRAIAAKVDLPISVDTMKASVAREALEEGAEMINDVSAMEFDADMVNVVSSSGAAVVLMHMRGRPKSMQTGDLIYRSLRGEIISYLQKRIEAAGDAGIDPTQIIVDPGLGFGKTVEDNMRLIHYLREFSVFGRPILVGPSRKAFIGRATGCVPSERDAGTGAAVTAAILNGGQVVRVHDVRMMKKITMMADSILRI